MDVKTAVKKAKETAHELFSGESVSPYQLEEVVFNDGSKTWEITLGYYVKDSRPNSGFADLVLKSHGDQRFERKYKIFKISDEDGSFISMTIRDEK